MSWPATMLTLFVVGNSSVSPSRSDLAPPLPLSPQELRLLESAEADTSTDSEEHIASLPTVPNSPARKDIWLDHDDFIDPSTRSRGVSVSEMLGQTDLALRFVRDLPGQLRILNQGQSSHRVIGSLDGTPLRHLLDRFDDQGALDLLDPISIAHVSMTARGLHLHRQSRAEPIEHKTEWGRTVWLQGGSILRDFTAGSAIQYISPHTVSNLHLSTAQPTGEYSVTTQNTKRHNANLRSQNTGSAATPFNWEVGADFDQVNDLIRWDLESTGRIVDTLRQRYGGFGKASWTPNAWHVGGEVQHYQYAKMTSGTNAIEDLEEDVLQSKLSMFGGTKINERIRVATRLGFQHEEGRSNFNEAQLKSSMSVLNARISGVGEWGTLKQKNQGKVNAVIIQEFINLSDGDQEEDAQYQRFQIELIQSVNHFLRLQSSAAFQPRYPSVADLRAGASASQESMLRVSAGPSLLGERWEFQLHGFAHWYEDRIIKTNLQNGVGQIDEDRDLGLLASARWNYNSRLGFSSFFIWEPPSLAGRKHQMYGQARVFYLYEPRNIFLEAQISQYDAGLFSSGLFLSVPVGSNLHVEVLVNNMFDQELLRPESTLAEPKLNLRATLKAYF